MREVKPIIDVLLEKDEIQERIKHMGEEITKDYLGKQMVIVCVLRGAVFFAMDLIKHIDNDMIFDFIQVSSYGGDTKSSGNIILKKDLDENLEGKDVLIVEDIADTGLTLEYLVEHIKKRNPASVKVAVFASKPERRIVEAQVDYIGFEIPNRYVVGYGFDYDNHYRGLPYVGCID